MPSLYARIDTSTPSRAAARNPSQGYGLRLEGAYLRLVPLRTPGDNGQARTFHRSDDGIKIARAWLDMPGTPTRGQRRH